MIPAESQGIRWNWRVLICLVISAGIIVWAVIRNLPPYRNPEKTFPEFKKLVEDGDLLVAPDKELAFVEEPTTGKQYIEGHYLEHTPDGKQHERTFITYIDLEHRKEEILALLGTNKRHPEYAAGVTARFETHY